MLEMLKGLHQIAFGFSGVVCVRVCFCGFFVFFFLIFFLSVIEKSLKDFADQPAGAQGVWWHPGASWHLWPAPSAETPQP